MNDEIKPGYLRVTEVIAPFSGIEFAPQDRVKAAGDRGTLVHKYIEAALNGFDWQAIPEEIAPYYQAWHEWSGLADKDPWITKDSKLIVEQRLYCDKHRITGQIDLIRIHGDNIYCYDWKTSYQPSISWGVQAAAYAYLLSVNGFPGASFQFIHLRRVGNVMETTYVDQEENLATFFKCLDLYKYFEMDKTRNKR